MKFKSWMLATPMFVAVALAIVGVLSGKIDGDGVGMVLLMFGACAVGVGLIWLQVFIVKNSFNIIPRGIDDGRPRAPIGCIRSVPPRVLRGGRAGLSGSGTNQFRGAEGADGAEGVDRKRGNTSIT